MFSVYVLYSKSFKKIYIGQSCNMQNRLDEHNSGISRYTRKFMPWELIYTENYETRSQAMRRERN